MGDNVKCIGLGDTNQVDNPHCTSANNALNWTVELLKGSKNYAHLVLKGKHSRGPITDLVLQRIREHQLGEFEKHGFDTAAAA